jgi:hypothetical protein
VRGQPVCSGRSTVPKHLQHQRSQRASHAAEVGQFGCMPRTLGTCLVKVVALYMVRAFACTGVPNAKRRVALAAASDQLPAVRREPAARHRAAVPREHLPIETGQAVSSLDTCSSPAHASAWAAWLTAHGKVGTGLNALSLSK